MCKLNIIITILTSLFGSGAGFPSPEPRRLLGLEEVKSFYQSTCTHKKNQCQDTIMVSSIYTQINMQ